MKKLMITLFTLLSVTAYGQDPVLTYSGNLYFIPGSMTKAGESYLVTITSHDYSTQTPRVFTIYDGDFNVVKKFTDPTSGIPYQERRVLMSCLYDLESAGTTRRAAMTDWAVEEDVTSNNVTDSKIQSFELYDDNNNYHSRSLYLSQTFFNDDEDFEYVRTKYDIIPITTKYEDYAKEHSTGEDIPTISPSYGNEEIDAMMRETGAEYYETVWNEEKGKYVFKLFKNIIYGGLYSTGVEVVSLDGTVKAYLPGITTISSAYNFRGKCYIRGYGQDNTNVLYLLGSNTTDIKEVSREKAPLSIEKIGNNLIVNNTQTEDQVVVVSNMGGQILRNIKAAQGRTVIPVNGLKGVYNITLFERSNPVKSAKMILK